MKVMDKKLYLLNKNLKHGDFVRFRVENQISGCYMGPLKGKLNLYDEIDPFIEAEFKGKPCIVTINNGYDAYIGTIERI